MLNNRNYYKKVYDFINKNKALVLNGHNFKWFKFKKPRSYHSINPIQWPIVALLVALILIVGLVLYINKSILVIIKSKIYIICNAIDVAYINYAIIFFFLLFIFSLFYNNKRLQWLSIAMQFIILSINLIALDTTLTDITITFTTLFDDIKSIIEQNREHFEFVLYELKFIIVFYIIITLLYNNKKKIKNFFLSEDFITILLIVLYSYIHIVWHVKISKYYYETIDFIDSDHGRIFLLLLLLIFLAVFFNGLNF